MGICNSVYTKKAPDVNHFQEENVDNHNSRSRKEVQKEVTQTDPGIILEVEDAVDEVEIYSFLFNRIKYQLVGNAYIFSLADELHDRFSILVTFISDEVVKNLLTSIC